MDKQKLQQDIDELKAKLAEMESELNKPEPVINYWQPKTKETYYYILPTGSIDTGVQHSSQDTRYRVFKTQEEAQAYAEYVKAEEALKAEIARLNEGWQPDWCNKNQLKFFIYLGYLGNHLDWSSCFINKHQPNFMYLKSKTLAGQLIKTHSKELKTYLTY